MRRAKPASIELNPIDVDSPFSVRDTVSRHVGLPVLWVSIWPVLNKLDLVKIKGILQSPRPR